MNNADIIKKYYPNFKDVGYFFKQYLDKYITNDSTILEIGCGRQSFGDKYYKRAKYKVGIDPDKEALKDNTLMDKKICSTIENIPETTGEFDVVIAQWVLEHVQNPEKDIRKIQKLCKKNGHFIFMTTNIHSPLIMLSKILSTSSKKYLRKILFDIEEDDTYPTVYKINSVSKIDLYLSKNGFKKIEIKKTGVLTYFSWNKYILLCKILYDRTIGKVIPIKTHIVGVYEKIK